MIINLHDDGASLHPDAAESRYLTDREVSTAINKTKTEEAEADPQFLSCL